MSNNQQKLLVLDLLDRLLGSWWTLVAGVCIGASLAVVVLHYTVPVYEAQATIEADVDRLPKEFVRRTVSDNVEIQLRELRQAVLSDENLAKVVTEVFGTPSSPADEQSLATRISSDVHLQYSGRTRTITVLYRDHVPDRAAQITNMLAELFVSENKGLRENSARRVRESVESLAAEVDAELAQKQKERLDLMVKHPYELESQRLNNEQAIKRLEKELDENEQNVRATRRTLKTRESLYAREREVEPGDGPPTDEPALTEGNDPKIVELQREIDELLTKLTENHPDVVAKRRELERYRAAAARDAATEDAPGSEARPSEPATIDVWDTRVRAIQLELGRLESRSEEIRNELARYRGYIARTPVTQKRLDDLEARLEVLRQTHADNQRKIEAAKTGQQLEQEDIANPFAVSVFAAPPSIPVSPNRLAFLLAGVVGGLLVFAGPVIAAGLLRPRILLEGSLAPLVDAPVLVAIPVIPTPTIKQSQRRAMWRNAGLSCLALVVALAVAAMQLANII